MDLSLSNGRKVKKGQKVYKVNQETQVLLERLATRDHTERKVNNVYQETQVLLEQLATRDRQYLGVLRSQRQIYKMW